MPDYKKGKIYKLEGGGKFYIGSTTNLLSKRRGDHHCDAKQERRQNTKAYLWFNSIGWENVSISLIEDFPCLTKQELLDRERYYIDLHRNDVNLLNVRRSIITDEDRKQQKASWYRSERGQEVAKKNHEDNKVKVNCICGMKVSKGCMAKHKKRQIHLINLRCPDRSI